MATPNKKPKLAVEDIDEIKDDIRDIRNDIERMKGDTHSMSRIMNLVNSPKIENDLVSVVGSSEYRAAILELTKEEIGRAELATELGIDVRNLGKFIDALLDKGYVAAIKRGRGLSYRRAESVDLLGIEKVDAIRLLIEAWRVRKASKAGETLAQPGNDDRKPDSSSGSRSEDKPIVSTSLPKNEGESASS